MTTKQSEQDTVNYQGEELKVHSPIIISASRSTDIPAYYAKWFINRLNAGYVIWYNPFNQRPMYISLKKARAVVFWTKNPAPLMPFLDDLDHRGLNYYFQYTLNDYDREHFEPNVPALARRIQTFKALSDKVGPDRIIWRFDPILLTPNISARDILMRIWKLGNQLRGLTHRLVISFIDIEPYRKVKLNIQKEFPNTIRAPKSEEIEEIAIGLEKIKNRWNEEGWAIEIQTCSEEIELRNHGITHTSCIDGELMGRLFPHDKPLMEFLQKKKQKAAAKLEQFSFEFGETQNEAIEVTKKIIPIVPISNANLKDSGQRDACGCIQSKDIGMYDTCPHFCVYCYANTNRARVLENVKKHKDTDESIIFRERKTNDELI